MSYHTAQHRSSCCLYSLDSMASSWQMNFVSETQTQVSSSAGSLTSLKSDGSCSLTFSQVAAAHGKGHGGLGSMTPCLARRSTGSIWFAWVTTVSTLGWAGVRPSHSGSCHGKCSDGYGIHPSRNCWRNRHLWSLGPLGPVSALSSEAGSSWDWQPSCWLSCHLRCGRACCCQCCVCLIAKLLTRWSIAGSKEAQRVLHGVCYKFVS